MVKIEQFKGGAKASVIRDGERKQVFLHQLITKQEFETLEVSVGSVVCSIDEQELVEKFAPQPEIVAAPAPKRSAKQIAQEAKLKQQEQSE